MDIKTTRIIQIHHSSTSIEHGIVETYKITKDIKYRIEDRLKELEEDKEVKYTGTLEPYIYITDITDINIEERYILGITATSSSYSGLLKFNLGNNIDIDNIERYKTYNIECKPLITTADIPYVEVLNIQESSEEDIEQLKEYKHRVSKYVMFKTKYNQSSLNEIIEAGNKEYYTWTDVDILKYQDWIKSIGYTDDNEMVSIVKTIDQLKDEQ